MVLYLHVSVFYTGIAFEANIPVNQLKCNQLSIKTINLFGFCRIWLLLHLVFQHPPAFIDFSNNAAMIEKQ